MPVILDFHITPQKKNAYKLQLFQRGSSQPLAASTFDYDLSFLTQFEINRLEPNPKDPQARLERLTEFGAKLYHKLFTPEIQEIWADHKRKADFLTLCLRIDPKADQLEILPWETLYDGTEFLAAGAKTGLSRLPLDVAPQDHLPPVTAPIKMLALLSSPLDLKENERLAIETEQEILLQAVNAPSGQGKLLVDFEDEAKLDVIETSLEAGYQILHYSGHGIPPDDGGGLLLEDAEGKRRPTPVAELLQTLQIAERDLRLAVISGCQTARTIDVAGFRDLARALLRRKTPAVIAMQFSVSDRAGLLFADNLYPRLIAGQSLDIAVAACRRILLHSGDAHIQADALAPVMLVSNSTPLKTKKPKTPKTTQPKIDFSFHLPLPQLQFGFYGRRREYRAIRDGLLHQNQRAIIIHGIGGIGKTALASHVATRLPDHFKGVYAFDCTSAALAPETILLELHRYLDDQDIHTLAQLLHKSFPPDKLATFISQVLSQLSLLIIFDNFETHLTAKDGTGHEITDENLSTFLKTLIKTTATGTHFLFTTRYLFDIDAKRIGTIAEVPLGDLSRPEAVYLMQRLPNLRMASYRRKLHVFDAFGGHPYALVTLDRHCAHKPLADVLEDAKGVHTELREFLAIELNYANLSDRARELLNRLAAFRKPVPPDAAEWVMGERVDEETVAKEFFKRPDLVPEIEKLGEEEFVKQYKAKLPEKRQAENIDDPITELIAWGPLTLIQEDGQVEDLTVHSLLRDFCRDKLDTKTWRNHLRDAAAYYTNQTRILTQGQKSPAGVWAELEAFELLFEAADFEDAASLLIAADRLLDRWGLARYLESQYRRILPTLDEEAQAIARGNLASILQNRGDYDAAIKEHMNVQKIFGKLGDRRNVAISLHQIGSIYFMRGDYDGALEYYKKSLKIKEELDDRAGVATSLYQIGMIRRTRGDHAGALEYSEEALKIRQELGDRAAVSESLHQIGMIHHDRGEYPVALKYYQKSLKIAEDLGHRTAISACLHQIAMIHQIRGEYPAALQYCERSLRMFEGLGERPNVARSHGQIGKLFRATKRYRDAFDNVLTALSIFLELQSPEAGTAVSDLTQLRAAWGPEYFDEAWKEKTGEDVPDWIKEKPKKPSKTKKKKKAKKTSKKKTKTKAKKAVKAKKKKLAKKTAKTKNQKTKNKK